jgi:hypothetical protein
MPLSDGDYAEVLAHLRRQVVKAGESDLDALIGAALPDVMADGLKAIDFPAATSNPRRVLMAYLELLTHAVGSVRGGAYETSLEMPQEYVTVGHGVIAGIELRVSEADAALYGGPAVQLGIDDDGAGLVAPLRAILRDLRDEGEGLT